MDNNETPETERYTAANLAKDVAVESVKTAATMVAVFAVLGAAGTVVKKLQERKASKSVETTTDDES